MLKMMIFMIAMLAPTSAAIIAFEDLPGCTGAERCGDFNDFVATVSGATVNGGGVFNNLTTGVLGENSNPFWDNPSLDGAQRNIGYCLTATGGCSATGAPYSTQYYATIGGGAVNSMSFTANGAVNVRIILEFAALANSNTFGWCPKVGCLSNMAVLFGGLASTGASASFNPGSSPFLFFLRNALGQTYFTDARLNIGESGLQQHAAWFDTTSPSDVPEPATSSVVGLGLLVLGAVRHRFKKK